MKIVEELFACSPARIEPVPGRKMLRISARSPVDSSIRAGRAAAQSKRASAFAK